MNESNPINPKPMGWLVGLAVLLITIGVVAGLVGIFVVAKRKQQYRINELPGSRPAGQTNALERALTNGTGRIEVTK